MKENGIGEENESLFNSYQSNALPYLAVLLLLLYKYRLPALTERILGFKP